MVKFIKMLPSRKRPKKDDIFLACTAKNMYLYGGVAKIIENNKDQPFLNGWNLIYVFNLYSDIPQMPLKFEPTKLLIPPVIVNNQGWLKGYFKTVGSAPIDFSLAEGYGFLKDTPHEFVNEEGQLLDYRPLKWVDYGLGSYATIEWLVEQALDDEGLSKLEKVAL